LQLGVPEEQLHRIASGASVRLDTALRENLLAKSNGKSAKTPRSKKA
jgi:hypothetical protein